MTLNESAQAACHELQGSPDGASNTQHDAELGITKTQLEQHERVDKGLQRRLRVVDTMGQADQG